jgi:ATP-dependent DNA ligase
MKKELKFKDWDGSDLKGEWIFSIKIDGMRLERQPDGTIVSRNGKPVYNLPKNLKKFEVAEVCCNGNWNDTMSICRASKSARRKVKNAEVYTIIPLDKRLHIRTRTDPKAENIKALFDLKKAEGYEGLVLYNKAENLSNKVKDKYPVDVKITGFVESTAKSKPNMLKEFITDMGSVGTGISRAQCKEFWENRDKLLGTYIEVEVMEITKSGKWRHPRFLRLRPDKS